MRKAFLTGVCSLLLIAPAASAQAPAAFKVALINMQQLFQVAPGRTEAAAALDKERAKANDEFKVMQDSMTKMLEAFEKDQATMSAEVKKTRTTAIQTKQASYQERAQKLEQGLQDKEAELLEPIQELMQKVLEDYRAENGFALMFDISAGAGLVAIDKNLDKTEAVMARLSKMPAPKAATTAAPAAKTPTGPTASPAGLTKKPPTQ